METIAQEEKEVNKKVFSLSEESKMPNEMDDAELYAQRQNNKDMEAAPMLVKQRPPKARDT